MKQEDRIVETYETYFKEAQVSVERIELLAKMVNLLCKYKGGKRFDFCKQIAPELFSVSDQFYAWNVEEEEEIVTSLKTLVFKEDGTLRKTKFNSSIRYLDIKIIQITWNAEEIQFLGYENFCLCGQYALPVYALIGKAGVAHVFVDKTWDDKLQVLYYETPSCMEKELVVTQKAPINS